jgi:hypothetical protein
VSIGRPAGWKPKRFEVTRWARAQAGSLSSRAAHLLLVLASYAETNEKCECWPSIRNLTTDLGLTVHVRRDGSAHNSQVYRALQELEDGGKIWRKQQRRSSTRYELLLPSDWQEGMDAARLGAGAKPSDKPSGSSEGEVPGVEVPTKSHPEEPDRNPPVNRRVSTSPPTRNDNSNGEDPKKVRETIEASLGSSTPLGARRPSFPNIDGRRR